MIPFLLVTATFILYPILTRPTGSRCYYPSSCDSGYCTIPASSLPDEYLQNGKPVYGKKLPSDVRGYCYESTRPDDKPCLSGLIEITAGRTLVQNSCKPF